MADLNLQKNEMLNQSLKKNESEKRLEDKKLQKIKPDITLDYLQTLTLLFCSGYLLLSYQI